MTQKEEAEVILKNIMEVIPQANIDACDGDKLLGILIFLKYLSPAMVSTVMDTTGVKTVSTDESPHSDEALMEFLQGSMLMTVANVLGRSVMDATKVLHNCGFAAYSDGCTIQTIRRIWHNPETALSDTEKQILELMLEQNKTLGIGINGDLSQYPVDTIYSVNRLWRSGKKLSEIGVSNKCSILHALGYPVDPTTGDGTWESLSLRAYSELAYGTLPFETSSSFVDVEDKYSSFENLCMDVPKDSDLLQGLTGVLFFQGHTVLEIQKKLHITSLQVTRYLNSYRVRTVPGVDASIMSIDLLKDVIKYDGSTITKAEAAGLMNKYKGLKVSQLPELVLAASMSSSIEYVHVEEMRKAMKCNNPVSCLMTAVTFCKENVILANILPGNVKEMDVIDTLHALGVPYPDNKPLNTMITFGEIKNVADNVNSTGDYHTDTSIIGLFNSGYGMIERWT